MKSISSEINNFLYDHRVGVLAITLPNETMHAAAIHYSYTNNPLAFFFSTHSDTRKCRGIINGEKQQACLVIGFEEKEWITFQADGLAYLITNNDELKEVRERHIQKFPENRDSEEDNRAVFIKFVPKWWRYSDFTTYPVTYKESVEE